MERRSDLLIQELKDLLGTDEVYFQPNTDVGSDDNAEIFTGMQFPCFVMRRSAIYAPRANDAIYQFRPSYQVTYIVQDEPDPDMLERLMRKFPHCQHQRYFVSDNLHHDVFMIYY